MGKRHVERWLLQLGAAMLALASTGSDRTLTYLVLADTVPPLMITTEDDAMAGGIVTDVIQTLASTTGHALRAEVIPWQRMTELMSERGDWLMYGPSSRCVPARGCISSSVPMLEFDHVVVTLAGSSLSVKRLEDLFGKRLLLVDNYHYPALDAHLATPVDAQGSGAIVDIRAFTPVGALRMLRHGRGDAYVDWRRRVLYNLADAGLAAEQLRLEDASHIVPTQGLHLFYSAKLPAELREQLDRALVRMHQDGSLRAILDRYGTYPSRG